MSNKIRKDKIEFYINNTCNFNCDNCNRLNNYHFAGYEKWQHHENAYREWSKKIHFDMITILGGEPTLNPTLDQWILGLRGLWPDSRLNVLSNGSRLKHWYQRGLFKILSETNTLLQITLHNRNRREKSIEEIKSFLKDPVLVAAPTPMVDWVESYNQVKDPAWPGCDSYQDFENLPAWIQDECKHTHGIDWDSWVKNTGKFTMTDRQDQGLRIEIDYAENFVTAPLKYIGNNQFAVYDSDPEAAHAVCWSKTCTHMMKGKMYKCHHVALLPEFAKQYDVKMTTQDQQLLEEYVPLTADADPIAIQSFVDNLVHAMPQCKLCPSRLENISLQSGTTKPKIKKIIPIFASLA